MKVYTNLGYAIAVQAVRDFIKEESDEEKQEIIKDLRSEWMEWLTDGMSIQLADKLESDAEGAKCRFKEMEEELENEALMQQLVANL